VLESYKKKGDIQDDSSSDISDAEMISESLEVIFVLTTEIMCDFANISSILTFDLHLCLGQQCCQSANVTSVFKG